MYSEYTVKRSRYFTRVLNDNGMEIILASCLEEDIFPVFIRRGERGGKLGIDGLGGYPKASRSRWSLVDGEFSR